MAPAESADAVEAEFEALLAAARAQDADGFAAAFDRLSGLQGPAAAPRVASMLESEGLADGVLAALKSRAQSLQTSQAWLQCASAACIVGNDPLTVEAASAASELDPNATEATFLLIVAANRRGDHELALRMIADLIGRIPGAQNDPSVVIQGAVAELGCKRPLAALARIEPAATRLTAAGLGFDAHALRARALREIPERLAEAADEWKRALASARSDELMDHARDNMLAALISTKRFDECRRELDAALEATHSQHARASWLDLRPKVLAASGDVDGALRALSELLEATEDRGRRLILHAQQTQIAGAAARWKDVASAFDAALSEIAPDEADAIERRRAVQRDKIQALFMHDFDRVRADLDALEAVPGSPGWSPLIDIRMAGLLAANRADEALTWLTNRLAGSPEIADHPAALHWRGEAELRRNNIDEAMQCFARAVQLPPDESNTRVLAAVLLSASAVQKWQDAVTAHERLAAADPDLASAPNLRVAAANAHLRLGDFEVALNLTDGVVPTALPVVATRDLIRGEALIGLQRVDDALAMTSEALGRLRAAAPGELPAFFTVSLHNMRAQLLNQRGEFEAARAAATEAIAVPHPPGAMLVDVTEFVRIAAFMQRSLAWFRLGKIPEAHIDVDAAIGRSERLRKPWIKALAENAAFGGVEAGLWIAKGSLLDAERRSEEALAAYTRAERLEKTGNAAAVARGYALAATGAYAEALDAFEAALTRAATAAERGDALAGKGRALVRLKRCQEAVSALQAALDARLTEPDNDPDVFELLGIAYNELQRTGAADRAFRRAWELTVADKRSANLARGVTTAKLHLGDPEAALKFLDLLPASLKEERTLLFNRALALDALGRRREAIACLVRARNAGLEKAQEEIDRLDSPAGLARWTHYWFGALAGPARRAWGVLLLIVACTGLAAPLVQWWLYGEVDGYLLLLPPVVALALLALPNLKSIDVDAGGLKLSAEPLIATGRDAVRAAPEGFIVPQLSGLAIAIADTRTTTNTQL